MEVSKQLWYDKESTAIKLRQINEEYNGVVQRALAVGKLLENYVCVKNIWNDENAVVFAKWWNQNENIRSDNGGKLLWDSTNKKLYMKLQTSSQSDGENKIRYIVSMSGVAYYIVTCKSFQALTSSYSVEMKQYYSKYIQVAGVYDTYINNFNGTRWPNLMSNVFGLDKWKTKTLPTIPKGNVTNIKKVKELSNKIVHHLKLLKGQVEDYNKLLLKIINNTDTLIYWGFSDDIKQQAKEITTKLSENSTSWLEEFSQSTYTALSTATGVIEGDLNTLAKINLKF